MATTAARLRLMQEIQAIKKSDELEKDGIEIVLKDEDKMDIFCVKLYDFPDDSELHADLQKLPEDQRYVLLELTFADDYPFSPPFVFVLAPRFQIHTGRVTIGGSICAEFLTKSGWSPAYTMTTFLRILKSTLVEGNGRVDFQNTSKYTKSEAHEAFRRVAKDHGWDI